MKNICSPNGELFFIYQIHTQITDVDTAVFFIYFNASQRIVREGRQKNRHSAVILVVGVAGL